jgi:hypothetical protein
MIQLLFALALCQPVDTVPDLPEISLLGNPGSDKGTQILERNSVQILRITGAETIQRAGDLTITDAIQRMEGLSIIRGNSGEDSRVIIRGMSPKYNTTLVDGLVIPSPDERDIPLDLFPSGLAQRVEVYKSLTPDMEGSGIGGLVNIVMKDAGPAPTLTLSLGTGYSQLFFNRTFVTFDRSVVDYNPPANDIFTKANLSFRSVHALPDLLGGMSYSHRFDHRRIGLVLAFDYQGSHRGSDGYFISTGTEPGLNNTPGATDYFTRQYSVATLKPSFYNQWDFRPNDLNKVTLFSFYTHQLEAESRMSVDTSLVEGRSGPGTGRIDILERSRLHVRDIYSSLLTGDHRLGSRWSLRWAGAFSYASGRYPDWAELDGSTGRLQSGDSILQTPLYLGPLERQWLVNKEFQEEGKASLGYQWRRFLLEGGGDFRHKTRDNFYTEYNFEPALSGGYGQPFVDIYHAQWLNNDGPENPLGSGANPNTYHAYEDIGALFLAARYSGPRFDVVGGVRRESTLQDVTSSVDPSQSYGQHISIRYADWLPSILFKYQNWRLSYYKGLSRPALSDVTFFSLVEEDFNIAGNPYLIRTTAQNLDLRYEHPSWSLGVFYKHLQDPFEKTLLNAGDTLYPLPQNGLPYTPAGVLTEQLRNYGSANNYGLEGGYTYTRGRWGANAHYTFTISRITQTSKWKTRVDPQNPSSDIETISRPETRPLEGQSMHLGGLSAWYKDPLRWTAQVSFTYTGARISDVSGWYGLDVWQKGYALLDLAAERRLGAFSLFARVSNVLNAATVNEIRGADLTVQRMRNGQRYMLGMRWNVLN